MDYFTAAGELIKATQGAGIHVNDDPSAYAVLANIPYWENLFPGAAGDGLTATQAVAQLYNTAPDYATALWLLDEYCYPSCSAFGPFATTAASLTRCRSSASIAPFELPRAASVGAQNVGAAVTSSTSTTRCRSPRISARPLSEAAPGERRHGGFSSILMNPWQPERQWGPSDFGRSATS